MNIDNDLWANNFSGVTLHSQHFTVLFHSMIRLFMTLSFSFILQLSVSLKTVFFRKLNITHGGQKNAKNVSCTL